MARPATVSAFAPYGWLIDAKNLPPAGPGGSGSPVVDINGGTSRRYDGLTGLSFDADGGTPCLALFRAVAQSVDGPWRRLERHRLGTQTFVPLRGVGYLVLVALGDAVPDESTLAAFLMDGDQGATLRAGVWHHGLIALEDGDFVVLERRGAAVDCDEATLSVPVVVSRGPGG